MKLKPDNCQPCRTDSLSGFGFRIGISLALAGQGMVFGLGYNNALGAGDAPAYGTTLYWALHGGLILSAVAVAALLGGPLLRETISELKMRRISVETLFVLSAFGAFGGSLISTIRGLGSVYYEVVSIVLCVYAIGRQIGAIQKGRIGEAVASFRQAFDSASVVRSNGGVETVPVAQVKASDRVRIRPGDPIPVDGVILAGNGYIRETALTGEPGPVSRTAGDTVMAGTWSVDGNFEIEPSPDCHRAIDSILELLESAPQAPSRLQQSADRLMQVFVPVVAVISVATFAVWSLIPGVPWMEALFNAMAVLLVACPCALGLAMPTGIWAGLYYLSQRGIIGRHGHLLDSLADCTTIVFDKTGTLTRFELEADTTNLDAGIPHLVDCIASLGKASQHPVSNALAGLSDAALAVDELKIYPGEGLGGLIGERHFLLGEAGFLRKRGIALPANMPPVVGKPVHVSCDGHYAGCVILGEELRPEAEASLESLAKLGCRIRILSGDPGSSRREIGGIPVEGGLSAKEKAARIREEISGSAHVLFIGDGVNDLPAMEASHASLAIDLGAALATEFSDGLLVDGRVGVLPGSIRHARRLKKNLRGNLLFALAYNLVGMSLAAAGVLHPVVAALLMVGSSVIVSYRALRAAGAGS